MIIHFKALPGFTNDQFSLSGQVNSRLTNEQSSLLDLIQKAILEHNEFDVKDSLPEVNVDPASLKLDSEYSCPIGQVGRNVSNI